MSLLTTIKHKLAGIKQAFGIHIILKQDGYDLFLVELARKKDLVLLINQQPCSSIEQLRELLPPDAVIGMRISGKGILSKSFDDFVSEEQLITKLLPNAKPEDFYLQSFVGETRTHASLIRKDAVTEWIHRFKDYFLVTIELGDEAEKPLRDMINLVESTEGCIAIGEEKLLKPGLPAFSAAFKSLLSLEDGTLRLKETSLAADEFSQKRIFQLGGVALLGITLIVLLANFLLFQNYRNANADIGQEASKYLSINASKDSLLGVIKQREDFLSKSGWMKNGFISKELDLMASVMPKELLLSSINFNPIDEKRSRESRKNQFQPGIIHITGETSNTVALNQWINDINKMSRVNTTNIVKYEYDSRNRVGIFKIAVETK